MTAQSDYVARVTEALGYEGIPPHHILRLIESAWLQSVSVKDAVASITQPSER